ncbi:MAG: TIGR02453 family protein [Spirochaetales bacterium]|nr:TIGR02453 family protein [Spirochaetales bacterium]
MLMGFQGFSDETFRFLTGLVFNNEKAWFEAHKKDYENAVVLPALALIDDLAPLVRAISPHYQGIAKKVGGSLMRIYRDTRFSRDKTPYKTNIGLQFRHRVASDIHAPGFYVHLDPERCFVGCGTWHPEPRELLLIRRALAERPDDFLDALKKSTEKSGLVPVGESLKLSPRGFGPDHPLASEIRRKDFLLSADLSREVVSGPQLIDELEAKFRASGPYMKFLCGALDLPF